MISLRFDRNCIVKELEDYLKMKISIYLESKLMYFFLIYKIFNLLKLNENVKQRCK